jgi:hypothetical protein
MYSTLVRSGLCRLCGTNRLMVDDETLSSQIRIDSQDISWNFLTLEVGAMLL